MDYYANSYDKMYNSNSFNMNSEDDEMEQLMAQSQKPIAASGAENVAKTGGNLPLAVGLTGLDFIQKQQAAKIAEAEARKKAHMYGITESTDMLNRSLDRYMQAVS